MKKAILILFVFLTAICQAQTFSTVGGNIVHVPFTGQEQILFAGNGFSANTYTEMRYAANWAPRNTTDGILCNPCISSLAFKQTDANGSVNYIFNDDPNAAYIITQNANGWFTTPLDTIITVQFGIRQWPGSQWIDTPVNLIFGNGGAPITTITTTVTTVTTTTKINKKKK